MTLFFSFWQKDTHCFSIIVTAYTILLGYKHYEEFKIDSPPLWTLKLKDIKAFKKWIGNIQLTCVCCCIYSSWTQHSMFISCCLWPLYRNSNACGVYYGFTEPMKLYLNLSRYNKLPLDTYWNHFVVHPTTSRSSIGHTWLMIR